MLSTKDIELLLVHAALQVQYQQPDQAIAILDAVLELEPERRCVTRSRSRVCKLAVTPVLLRYVKAY